MAARPGVAGARKSGLAARLLRWYKKSHRDLPWRRTADPYRIWVSEIMLQQTRVQAAIPYYERFLERFPDLQALAAAVEEQVLTVWSGLGYYSRARNLHRAARTMVAGGGFPKDYEGIRAMPGVGEYTAAAVASMAFQLPYAAVDGNVLRVVSRIQNDASDIKSPRVQQRFRAIAQEWLPSDAPGTFNQALMELGSTVCLPKNPLCRECPLATDCQARAAGTAAQLPVKLGGPRPQRIEAVLLLAAERGRVLLRRRETGARRMAGFWELPSPEHLPSAAVGASAGEFRHTITHHHYTFTVKRVARGKTGRRGDGEFAWFAVEELGGIPLSTTARKALELVRNL
jgi:A/G-specific adenine glycosylase